MQIEETNYSDREVFDSKQIKDIYNSYDTLFNCDRLASMLNTIKNDSSINYSSIEDVRALYNYYILKHYPNETSIKAKFINNVLLKTQNHVSIFELPVGSSRVDLCKINGESIAYEIKSDLDNFSRLDKQLHDYLLVFEKVYVICSMKNIEKIKKLIPKNCGIYTYSIRGSNYYFKAYKKAIISRDIDPIEQLRIFNKKELIKHFSIKEFNLEIKETVVKEIAENNSTKIINNKFKEMLKGKYKNKWSFLRTNSNQIHEIDYQWFYKNNINPKLVYF